MEYVIEIFDAFGLRRHRFNRVPLVEISSHLPGRPQRVRGMLPSMTPLRPGDRVRVWLDGALAADADVTRVDPEWGDQRKLVIDRYLSFHELLAFEAVSGQSLLDSRVTASLFNRSVTELAKEYVNRATGRIHYTVEHTGYPEGAEREYAKFQARRMGVNELEAGGIEHGDWVGASRIDASNAYAKDGRTIAGLVVDGAPWPDLRLLMVEAESPERDSDAIARHPEVAHWSDATYASSGYALAGAAAKEALQARIENDGIVYVELNPCRDVFGQTIGRIDEDGRLLGMIFGAGRCFNAAQVELGHGRTLLHANGAILPPALRLKEFFSYERKTESSIAALDQVLKTFHADGPLEAALTVLAYAAGAVWSVNERGVITMRRADRADHVTFHDPSDTAVAWSADARGVVNAIDAEANPAHSGVGKTYERPASVAILGCSKAAVTLAAVSHEADLDAVINGMLDDLAYPERTGHIVWLRGNAAVRPGNLVEIRNPPVERVDAPIEGEWGGRYAEQLMARVASVTHRLAGRHVQTKAKLTSPLRNGANPVASLRRAHPGRETMAAFRLDDEHVGLDMGYHLDGAG